MPNSTIFILRKLHPQIAIFIKKIVKKIATCPQKNYDGGRRLKCSSYNSFLYFWFILYFSHNQLQLVDRSLMPGDVVRRLIPGQESQCGFVMNLDVHSHLRILQSNKYIYNVNSKDLQPIEVRHVAWKCELKLRSKVRKNISQLSDSIRQ